MVDNEIGARRARLAGIERYGTKGGGEVDSRGQKGDEEASLCHTVSRGQGRSMHLFMLMFLDGTGLLGLAFGSSVMVATMAYECEIDKGGKE